MAILQQKLAASVSPAMNGPSAATIAPKVLGSPSRENVPVGSDVTQMTNTLTGDNGLLPTASSPALNIQAPSAPSANLTLAGSVAVNNPSVTNGISTNSGSGFSQTTKTTKIPGVKTSEFCKRATGVYDVDGNEYVNLTDVELLGKLGYDISAVEYSGLEKTSESLDLYSYIEKVAGIPKEVSAAVDRGEAFSGEFLKEMSYSIPKGYEVKGDLVCPLEKKAAEDDQHKLVHYSNKQFEKLRPLTYEELLKDRISGRWEKEPDKAKKYVEGRKDLENYLRKRLKQKGILHDKNKTFLYATLDGREQFAQPDMIKHEALLTPEIINQSFFDVVGLPSRTMFGQKGLDSAIRRWDKNKDNLKTEEYMGMTIRPRIEIMTPAEIATQFAKKAEVTHELKSSNIKAVGYDKENKSLDVEFLKDMGYSIPKGYEVKGDLCVPIEKKGSALIVSGIHGDEPAGNMAAEKLKNSADIVAHVNPSKKRRFEGKDINRHFDKPTEGKTQKTLLDIIRKKKPSKVIALHEDDEVDKPYAYSSESLKNEAREALKNHDTASSAHGDKTEDGVISDGKNPPDGSLEKALDNRDIPRVTLETPSKAQDIDKRVETQLDVVKKLLNKTAEDDRPHHHLILRIEADDLPNSEKECNQLVEELAKEIDMKIVYGPKTKHLTNPETEGYSTFAIITTSHISLHTWNKTNPPLMQIDIFSCNAFSREKVEKYLRKKFKINKISDVFIDRTSAVKVKTAAADPSQTILITGHSGAGKSTLAKALAEKLNLPLHRVDAHPEFKEYVMNDKGHWQNSLTPGTEEYKHYTDIVNRANKDTLSNAAASSIIEGTQLGNLSPEELSKYKAHILVGGDLDQSIAQRIQRTIAKANKKGKVLSPEDIEELKIKSKLVANYWKPGIEKFKKIPGIIGYNHTEHQLDPLVKRLQELLTKRAAHELKSTNIKSVGYNKENKSLDVEFHSGGTYTYKDVPKSLFDRIRKVKSPGKFFHKHIKKDNKFEYNKLEKEAKYQWYMSKPLSERLTAGRPYPFSYLTGETKELIDAVKNRDWENFKEEIGDTSFGAQMLLAQATGLNHPVYADLSKAWAREKVWKDMFGEKGGTYHPKHMQGGSNYAKASKIIKAFQSAGIKINQREAERLANKYTGGKIEKEI